jgi:tetratricopeptide (TPR) repeat protein
MVNSAKQQFTGAARSASWYKKRAGEARGEDVEKWLRAGLRAHPDSYDLWHRLGICLRSLGGERNDLEAINAFRKAISLAPPGNIASFTNLAGLLTKKAEFGEAEQILLSLLKSQPDDKKILFSLGDHYQKRADFIKDAEEKSHFYDLSLGCFGKAVNLPRPRDELYERDNTRFVRIAQLCGNDNWQPAYNNLRSRIREIVTPQTSPVTQPAPPKTDPS